MNRTPATSPLPRPAIGGPRSGGAVIIIVLTLLSTLVFLGFFFFGFSNQAQQAAVAYAQAPTYEIESEGLIDQSMEQLLVGTRAGYEESALWGNRHSILSHIVGPLDTNLQPVKDTLYSGQGIGLVLYTDPMSSTQYMCMDYNGDGIADDSDGTPGPDFIAYQVVPPSMGGPTSYTEQGGFRLNFSRVSMPDSFYQNDAFNGLPNAGSTATKSVPRFDPSVGYTYPDLNSLFLAHDSNSTFVDPSSGSLYSTRVVIPSFFRPQLMFGRRDANGDNADGTITGGGQNGFSDVFTNTNTAAMSLRPHSQHRNYFNGNASNTYAPRFLISATQAQSGNTTRIIQPFPFRVDLDLNNKYNEMGVFTDAALADGRYSFYEYDFDADNDGVRDSIWMDLGLQMITLPDGRQVVPLVAFKVIDGDGLLNANLHGNGSGIYHPTPDANPSNPLVFDRNSNGTLDAGDARYPISNSNMGLGPSEVNPSYGMFDDVSVLSGAAQTKVLQELAAMGVNSATRPVVSAAESSFLLTGRGTANGSILVGRHGESNVLTEFLSGTTSTPPRAGRTLDGVTTGTANLADDDLDSPTSGGIGYVAAHPMNNNNTYLTNIPIPPGIHPLPFSGQGIQYLLGTAAGAARLLAGQTGTDPSVWPSYAQGHWHDQNSANPQTVTGTYPYTPFGTFPYVQAGSTPGTLMPTTYSNDLVDEDDEIVASAALANGSDALFSPAENAGLQLPDADFKLLDEPSRLRQLAPLNFRDSPNAVSNRKMFTTESWDRKEFGRPATNSVRSWEFNAWSGTSLNGVSFTAGDLFFPPQFGAGMSAIPVGSNTDPLRVEFRQLLATRFRNSAYGGDYPNFDSSRSLGQHRLNLNQLLDTFDGNGNPIYRPLTPHPVYATTETATILPMVHTQHVNYSTTPSSGAPTTAASTTSVAGKDAMEWWARYDRQRMARDIYTLLWIVSAGNDANDYSQIVDSATTDDTTTTTGREDDDYSIFGAGTAQDRVRGRDRVREMAQFAVNVVDAIDPDSVITEFVYDENLTDGWDNSSTPFAKVYGVEAAQLTFSEGLAVKTTATMDPNDVIEFNNASNPRYHLFVELRNASPFPVPVHADQWRLRRIDIINNAMTSAPNPDRWITIHDATTQNIAAGATYLIGSQDGNNVFPSTGNFRPSDLRIDADDDGNYDLIVPNIVESSGMGTGVASGTPEASYPAPNVNLDLFHTSHSGRFTRYPTTPMGPANLPMLDSNTEPTVTPSGSANVRMVLERRMNPFMPDSSDTSTQNPWIEVDRISIPMRTWSPPASSGPVTGTIQTLKSVERIDPFDPRIQLPNYSGADSTHANTMPYVTAYTQGSPPPVPAQRNSNSPNVFTHWQPHFDRPFSSVIDLLSIPLYGYAPSQTTILSSDDLNLTQDAAIDPTTNDVEGAARMFRVGGPTKNLLDSNQRMSGHRVAGTRILYPEPALPSNMVASVTGRTELPSTAKVQFHTQNRWYRFLEFVEVPDQTDAYLASHSRWQQRTPGKINLNTVRHEPALAGLIDDQTHISPVTYPNTYNGASPTANSMTADLLTIANGETPGGGGFVTSPPGGTPSSTRNWFKEMLQMRDGIDPYLASANIGGTIPGVFNPSTYQVGTYPNPLFINIGSKPFRPLSFVRPSAGSALDSPNGSLQDTILRSRMLTVDDSDSDGFPDFPHHGLFEARHSYDRTGKGGVSGVNEDSVDFHTRNRLLAKIQNRTTERSHVFFVWAGIGFFEAHRVNKTGGNLDGQVQIGAQAEDIPVRRAFMVCDMSRIEDAYEDPNPNDSYPGYFDFRKFIIYRKLIK